MAALDVVIIKLQIRYPRGTTRTFDALTVARQQVFGRNDNRADVQDIIVLFTDGQSNDFSATIDAARMARLNGECTCDVSLLVSARVHFAAVDIEYM